MLDGSSAPVEWMASSAPVPYPEAVAFMERRAGAIAEGIERELVWLLEHPPLYTAGTSARAQDLLDANRFPVFPASRGGQLTYHGPGQRVVYLMIDLKRLGGDIRAYVRLLESVVIDTLASFGVVGVSRPGRVGVWVPRPDLGPGREDKIAAIGIRVRRSVAFHGFSLNVAPDLDHYAGIVPCGLTEYGVTSLSALGRHAPMAEIDAALRATFEARLAPTRTVAAPRIGSSPQSTLDRSRAAASPD